MVYIFFVIAFVIFALSFLHLHLNIPDIEITRQVHEAAYEGDALNVKIGIKNRRGLAAYFFELFDCYPGALPDEEKKSLFILNLEAKETIRASYITNCYKRGVWRLGPISIIAQDALGFFKSKKSFDIFSEIIIYPGFFRIFSL